MGKLRDQILKHDAVPSELVKVPEWEATVLLRGLTAGEASDLYDRTTVKNPRTGELEMNRRWWGPELLMACVYDPEVNQPVFDKADRDAIGRMPAAVVQRLQGIAARLSGLGVDAVEAAEEDLGVTPSPGT